MSIMLACILIFVCMLCGLPVAYSFLGGSLLYMILDGGKIAALAGTAFSATNSFAYLAMPLFILAGTLMTKSGIAEQICKFCNSILRRFKGGMAAALVLASALFGMLTGSNTATIMATNSFMGKPMRDMGWDDAYIAAMLASAGPLGYMIPPNAHAIMFAVVASCSVADLFLAGLIPGILWAVLMMVTNRFLYKKYFNPDKATEQNKEIAQNEGHLLPGETNGDYLKGIGNSFVKSIPALLMPLIIFGGIYGGVFTATEAGAVSGLYAILLGFVIKRVMKPRDLWDSFTSTGRQMGVILFITPMSAIFSRMLVLDNVPQLIANTLLALSSNEYVIMLLIDLVFIIAGLFVGPTVIVYVITPLLMPTAKAIGMDMIQLGAILFVAIGVGNITPPMASNLFIASKAVGVDSTRVIPPMLVYFVCVGLPVLLLTTFVPELSLWLPSLTH